MKKLLLSTFAVLYAGFVFASSQETYICLKNTTDQAVYISVTGTHNADWDGGSRPDNNFNNIVIAPNKRNCQREEINTGSSASNEHAFQFIINNNSVSNISIYNPNEESDQNYYWLVSKMDIQANNYILQGGYWHGNSQYFDVGFTCSGTYCYEFNIVQNHKSN